MAKVTVLTAVYNAGPYLRQCLDSLRRQTLADCQFICVDDCSTDHSWTILQDYAATDKRFQLLRTPVNSGPAVARNLALHFAQGDYITMLDADDWLSDDALELACQALRQHQADCVIFDLQMYDQHTAATTPWKTGMARGPWPGSEAFRLSLYGAIHGLYMLRADIHKAHPYDTTTRLYSDDATTHIHYLYAHTVCTCQGQYFYRQHTASTTQTLSVRFADRMLSDLSLKQQLQPLDQPDADLIRNHWETQRWLNIVDCYARFFRHGAAFTPGQRADIAAIFTRVLPTIETRRIPWRLKLKPGYCPIRHYAIFRLVENVYLTLQNMKSAMVGTVR